MAWGGPRQGVAAPPGTRSRRAGARPAAGLGVLCESARPAGQELGSYAGGAAPENSVERPSPYDGHILIWHAPETGG